MTVALLILHVLSRNKLAKLFPLQVWFEFRVFLLLDWLPYQEPSLSYYLPIAGRRTTGFIPFPGVLVLCEIQTASSRVWTRIVHFTSTSKDTRILLVPVEYYTIKMGIIRTLLEKQRWAHKWCSPMDPFIWPSKSKTTSSNLLHTAALWGYGI